jgi:hypothetical protein
MPFQTKHITTFTTAYVIPPINQLPKISNQSITNCSRLLIPPLGRLHRRSLRSRTRATFVILPSPPSHHNRRSYTGGADPYEQDWSQRRGRPRRLLAASDAMRMEDLHVSGTWPNLLSLTFASPPLSFSASGGRIVDGDSRIDHDPGRYAWLPTYSTIFVLSLTHLIRFSLTCSSGRGEVGSGSTMFHTSCISLSHAEVDTSSVSLSHWLYQIEISPSCCYTMLWLAFQTVSLQYLLYSWTELTVLISWCQTSRLTSLLNCIFTNQCIYFHTRSQENTSVQLSSACQLYFRMPTVEKVLDFVCS